MLGKSEKGLFDRTKGAVAIIVAALMLVIVPTVSADTSYSDVSEGESHYEAIMALTQDGVVKGYENGRYGQWNNITREQVAVIFYRAFDLDVPSDLENVLNDYNDVDADYVYAEEIAAVSDAGIFKGNDGSFLPGEPITREQVASVILRATDLEAFVADETQDINLEGVDESHQAQVQILADLDITNQFEDFRPIESISRGAFATMFYRLDQKIDELGNAYKLFDRKILKDINVDNMYSTIEYLSQSPRVAGTDSEYQAVLWIQEQFEELGYETELQPFSIYNNTSEGSINVNGEAFEFDANPFTGGVNAEASGELMYVGLGAPDEIGNNVEGKIALIERGELTFIEKVTNVLEKGAIGVIMYNNGDTGSRFGQLDSGQEIPAVSISKEAGEALLSQLKEGTVEVDLNVEYEEVELTSHNVIATLKPDAENDTGQIIGLGAHHDSVGGSPGANDDASGVSAVLELARIYAEYPIDTEVRFMTFGAEERGLLGARHYVSELSEDEIDRMVALYQMDMIAAADAGEDHPLGGLIMYTVDGEKNVVTDFSAASAQKMLTETLPYGQLGRSDHVPFHEAGIPAALFIHSPVEPWYHTPDDTLDRIDVEKLQQVAEIVGVAAYQIARPETPKLESLDAGRDLVDYPFEDRPVQ